MKNMRSMMACRHGAWIAVLGPVMAAMTGGHAIAAADDPYPQMAPVSQYLIASRAEEISLARAPRRRQSRITRKCGCSARTATRQPSRGRTASSASWAGHGTWRSPIRSSGTRRSGRRSATTPPRRGPCCRDTDAHRAGHGRHVQGRDPEAGSRPWVAGTLKAPEPGAVCYMMSKGGYLNDAAAGPWHPHVMYFAPRTEDAAWGANLPGSPVDSDSASEERTTIFFVAVPHWSDGTPCPHYQEATDSGRRRAGDDQGIKKSGRRAVSGGSLDRGARDCGARDGRWPRRRARGRRRSPRPEGPCDIYAAAGDPCVAAHSTTRALYAAYNGPLYQVLRQSDGKTMDIGVVQPGTSTRGGYAERGRAGRVLRQHVLLDHHGLRPVRQAQRPDAGAARRIQRPGDGRVQQRSGRRHGARHGHGATRSTASSSSRAWACATTTRKAPRSTTRRRDSTGSSMASTTTPAAASTTATPRSTAATTATARWKRLTTATPPAGITGPRPARGS